MRFFFCLFCALTLAAGSLQADSPDFKPSWWCRGAHVQTIYGGLFRSVPELTLYREKIETPDGDFFDADWAQEKFDPSKPIVIILPGLGSNSGAAYVRRLLEKVLQAGWQGVVLNARGAGGEVNRIRETAHSGRTGDLDFLVQSLINRKAGHIEIAGFSVGGNVTLKWLGEKGNQVPSQVRKAAAVSVPYDLEQTSKNLAKGFSRVYTDRLLKTLIPYALEKEEQFPGSLDIEKVKAAKTFEVYDREVTAKLNGFTDEKDYWQRSSSKGFLPQISIRVLLIHAANDPFLPEKFLPREIIKANSNLQLVITRDGGHLGFVSGSVPGQTDFWLEDRIVEFFSAGN